MHFSEAINIALGSLWANKLRSVLTLLGVVLGVAAVILVVTLIEGVNGYMAEKVFNLGADVVIVSKAPNAITNVDEWIEAQKRKDITFEDYEVMLERCNLCKAVGASITNPNGNVRYREQSITDSRIRGWSPSMPRVYDHEVVQGRTITEFDQRNGSQVAVIGNDILENLLPATDPIGKEVNINGIPYTVIGVGKKEGKTLGQSRDNYVIIPISAWFKQFGSRQSITMLAKAPGVDQQLQATLDEIRVIMRGLRKDRLGAPDSFQLDTNDNFLSIWANISGSFFFVTVGLAAISLIVGGIVIMNIMLVSVTERTREIGIRKALGAKKRDVLAQFMIESGTMALVGGLIGVLLGAALGKTVTLIVGMPSVVKLWSVLAGLLVATSVGVFFGVYPARRAADLDPIAALRFEL